MNPSEMLGKLMSGQLVVVVATEPVAQTPMKPKLSPDEQALADSLVSIAGKYGKFNEDETGIWAGYESAKDNVVAHIGVKCSNCALYEGNGVCKIIAQKVEDGGKCRFAVIPDGVVQGVYDPSSSKPEKPASRKKSKRPPISVKALGAAIGGGGGATAAADMIDRDGDGVIFDGTPDEQPVKRKPKRDYEPMDNSFLEKRRRKFVRSELNRQGVAPTSGNRPDEEVVAREDARAAFTVDEDRKRFVRNQLRKRGMTPTATGADRSSDERQARREARAEYDRRMRAGEPQREQAPAQEEPPRQYPPGYVPGKPADRYPDPGAYVPGKPVDRYPQANIPPRAPQRPPAGSIPPGKGRGAGQWGPATPKPDQGEWDGIVRGRGMQYVASQYPNRPGGVNSRVAKDPKWIAEQIKRQRESQAAVDHRNDNARKKREQRERNNADRRELAARTEAFYARGGGRVSDIKNQTAASPISRARSGGGSDREGQLNRDSNGRPTGVDRTSPKPYKPRQVGPSRRNAIPIPTNPGRRDPNRRFNADDVSRYPSGQNPRMNPQPKPPMKPGGSDGRYDKNKRNSGGFNPEGR